MRVICTLFFVVALCGFANNLFAQASFAQKVTVHAIPEDSLSFINYWAYPWDIDTDGLGRFAGKFDKRDTEQLKPEDTAHLYFTSNCETNIQGGYSGRYCHACIKKGIIKLKFSFGAPVFASEYYAFIKGDSFYCKAETVYPISSVGEQLTDITKQQTLVLGKRKYMPGDTLKGYINFTFRETSSAPGRKTYRYTYYFRGFFCTRLGVKEAQGW